MHGSSDQVILVILIIIIAFFFVITIALFFVTVYLRAKNSYIQYRDERRSKKWDPIILDVMDGNLSPKEAFERLKWRNSIAYLLRLELYIDMVKGEEKKRLLGLGKMSMGKLHHLLQSRNRRKELYGVHLLGLFDPKDQFKYLKFHSDDFIMTLTMIREMRTINEFRVKEHLIHMLFMFKYLSPVYFSNILVDMGTEITPILKMIIRERQDHPYEQIVAIETIKRMHYADCLPMTKEILTNNDNPLVLTACLRYQAEMGDESYAAAAKALTIHPNTMVRKAAVDAYLTLANTLRSEDIVRFFNDPTVQVAVSAAKKLRMFDSVPYFEMEEIDKFKWADIYKRMVY